jgi:hypothetical protein
MIKIDFLKLMQFPIEWLDWEMYPDDLFDWQISRYQSGHEDASEHDRNGAFHWWLRRSPDKNQLEKLLRLAALDPEPFLGPDVCQYLRKATNYDQELSILERQLFKETGY